MPLERDIRDAYGNSGDRVSRDWLVPILLQLLERCDDLEDRVKQLEEKKE